MKKKTSSNYNYYSLFITVGGFWGYNQYFKSQLKTQQQLYNQFGEDFFNSFPDKTGIADNSEPKLDNSKITAVPEKSDEERGQTVATDAAKSFGQGKSATENLAQEEPQKPTTSTSVNPNIPAQLTAQDIVIKYMPQINSLQNLALSRLDSLYSAAKNAYLQDNYDSPYFPPHINRFPSLPTVLYYRGNLHLPTLSVGIVGSRRCSVYGKEVAAEAAAPSRNL